MTTRVGVIGLGNMGAHHASTLHRFVAGAQVTALADVDRGRAEAVAAQLPISTVTEDAAALIASPDVDAVVIASHDSTHAAYAIACLHAGKPVLCEKPLAPVLDESARVVEAELAAVGPGGPPLISLGFMRRFDPPHVQLREAIADGRIGAPLLVHCSSRTVASYPGTRAEDVITGSAVHEFDTLPWLLGSPLVEASWHAGRPSSQVAGADGLQDPQLMLLRTESGVLVTVECFVNAGYGYDIRCEVVGETGVSAVREPARLVTEQSGQRAMRYHADWRGRFAEAYRLELQAWVDAVAGRSQSPLATARDGLITSAVADAVIASMRAGGSTIAVSTPSLAGATSGRAR